MTREEQIIKIITSIDYDKIDALRFEMIKLFLISQANSLPKKPITGKG